MPGIAEALLQADRREFDVHETAADYRAALRELWEPPPDVDAVVLFSREDDGVRFSRTRALPLDWSIAFTPNFRKAVEDMDKKMQGRILAAISELSETPNAARGDTVKPLVGERKGLWRYRLGDFRLVYEPREDSHLVVLLDFGARGGIYE
jgi:mRNA interferase RelE/StbE